MNRIILNETSYFGAGCRSVIAVEAARRGFKKAFFVTDKDLIKFGVAAEIIKVFDENQIPYELYSDVKANPTIANVQNGVAAYKASGADFIVALGGGSSIDTAKGIGIVVNNPDFADVKSLEGVADTKHKAVPTFALPTTAGTAAEVTINYVIIDEDARKKMVCVDPNDIPGYRRPRTDVLNAEGAYCRYRYGCFDTCHRKLYYSRCLGNERYVRIEGY